MTTLFDCAPYALAYAPVWWATDKVVVDTFVLQVFTFVALLWYAWETLRMRKAQTDQVKALRAQLRVSEDQVEAQEKPCLALFTNRRSIALRRPWGICLGTMLTEYASAELECRTWAMPRS